MQDRGVCGLSLYGLPTFKQFLHLETHRARLPFGGITQKAQGPARPSVCREGPGASSWGSMKMQFLRQAACGQGQATRRGGRDLPLTPGRPQAGSFPTGPQFPTHGFS